MTRGDRERKGDELRGLSPNGRHGRLLQKCAGELAVGGRLICIDAVLPPLGDPASLQLKLMDLHMMVSLPGTERTEDEWRRLFDSAGFALDRIVHPDPRRGASLIEGVRTRS